MSLCAITYASGRSEGKTLLRTPSHSSILSALKLPVDLVVTTTWLTPLKPSAVRLLGRPPPLGVRDFPHGKLRMLMDLVAVHSKMKCMASSTTPSVHLVHVRSMKVTPSNRAFSTLKPLLPNLNLVKLVRTSVESGAGGEAPPRGGPGNNPR
ncbi:hypothetical protein HaLaN_31398 [Haematococcus lacustris]|uniref:Uncharacterized protein n=1 Tax=Haematococcus lacustris TaxID=44745 RepID=A0A6A0AJN9_HAELA|nr:hypothetical protein HaLaN_31398 [Haematococcus lacustris]